MGHVTTPRRDIERRRRTPTRVHPRRFDDYPLRMPVLAEALRFAENRATSDDQLRLACELLALDSSGTHDELRDRLLAHLNTLDSETPVVCLNPKVQA